MEPVSPVVAARSRGRPRRAGAACSPARRSLRRACHHGAMVDWQLAAKVAEGVAALQPSGDPAPFQALVRPADEAERLVSAYTGLKPLAGALPVAEAVDRAAWIDANLRSMRGVLDPGRRQGDRAHGLAGRRRRRRRGRRAGGRGRRDLGLPRRPRARPVRVPGARPGGARAAAVRRAQPRPRRRHARRGARPAPALGRAARDHARAAVRRRAVAARAPRRAWCVELTTRWTSIRRSSSAACPAWTTCAGCSTPSARAASRPSCSAPSGAR